jgi:hypothetical protein
MSTRIIIETSDPNLYPRYWTVRADGELPEHQVAMHVEHGLHAAVFHCSCGSKYSWSCGVEFDPQPCAHILRVCLVVLAEMNEGTTISKRRASERRLKIGREREKHE